MLDAVADVDQLSTRGRCRRRPDERLHDVVHVIEFAALGTARHRKHLTPEGGADRLRDKPVLRLMRTIGQERPQEYHRAAQSTAVHATEEGRGDLGGRVG